MTSGKPRNNEQLLRLLSKAEDHLLTARFEILEARKALSKPERSASIAWHANRRDCKNVARKGKLLFKGI